MKFVVKCMVCNESLSWEQSGITSWGIIPLDDSGCAEVTIQDPSGVVSAHMTKHREDGSYLEAWKKLKHEQNAAYGRMVQRGHL